MITHVSDAEAPQLILATPKLHYPFGKDGSFHFPPIKIIHLYEKLDGTNVLAYRCRDEQSKFVALVLPLFEDADPDLTADSRRA